MIELNLRSINANSKTDVINILLDSKKHLRRKTRDKNEQKT